MNWWAREDLNLHEPKAHQPLKLTRLPIPPLAHDVTNQGYVKCDYYSNPLYGLLFEQRETVQFW